MVMEKAIEVSKGELRILLHNTVKEVYGEYKSKGGKTRIAGEVEFEPIDVQTLQLLDKVMVTVEYGGERDNVIATYPNKKDSYFTIQVSALIVTSVDLKTMTATRVDNVARSLIKSDYNSWVHIENELSSVFPIMEISLNGQEIPYV